jgi:hypothetical protein
MIIDLAITDITRMNEVRICIAATSLTGISYRPKYRTHSIRLDWLHHQGEVIRPFSIVQFDLDVADPQPPHTEDWFVDPGTKSIRGYVNNRRQYLESIVDPDVASIFGSPIHPGEPSGYFISSGTGNRSLGTIRAVSVSRFQHRNYNGRWDYRMFFTDESEREYRLKIVDLNFQMYIDWLRENQRMDYHSIERYINRSFLDKTFFLRIGLGRGWADHPECCFLQINSVFSFPDYLDGRCFADFVLNGHEELDDDEMSF